MNGWNDKFVGRWGGVAMMFLLLGVPAVSQAEPKGAQPGTKFINVRAGKVFAWFESQFGYVVITPSSLSRDSLTVRFQEATEVERAFETLAAALSEKKFSATLDRSQRTLTVAASQHPESRIVGKNHTPKALPPPLVQKVHLAPKEVPPPALPPQPIVTGGRWQLVGSANNSFYLSGEKDGEMRIITIGAEFMGWKVEQGKELLSLFLRKGNRVLEWTPRLIFDGEKMTAQTPKKQ